MTPTHCPTCGKPTPAGDVHTCTPNPRIQELERQLALTQGAMRADDERLRTHGTRVGLYFDCDTAEHMADEIESLRAQLAESQALHAKAQANYQFMVDRAANEKLDGYRELGARAANAENATDALKTQLAESQAHAAELREALEHMQGCRYCGEDGWSACDGGRRALIALSRTPAQSLDALKRRVLEDALGHLPGLDRVEGAVSEYGRGFVCGWNSALHKAHDAILGPYAEAQEEKK